MKRTLSICSGLIALIAIGCQTEKSNDEQLAILALAAAGPQAAVVNRYADLSFQLYSDSYDEAVKLQAAVNTFSASRTTANLTAVREQWTKARQVYLQTETLRFADGPIDNPDVLSVSGTELEGLLNAWPMDEVFNECYLLGNNSIGGSGCSTVRVSESDLLAAQGVSAGGAAPDGDTEKNISVGWHPIEYLLWGVDSDSAAPTAASTRINYFTDATHGANRTTYLVNVTNILVDHLKLLKDAWDPSIAGSYSATFRGDSQALTKMITGMASFTRNEFGGERFNGLTLGDQEEEHSCFSDTTNQDFYYNAQGVEVFFTGDYNGQSGAGLDDLYPADKATTIKNALAQAKSEMNPDTAPRFELAVTNANATYKNTLQNTVQPGLQNAGDAFVDGASSSLGISITPRTP